MKKGSYVHQLLFRTRFCLPTKFSILNQCFIKAFLETEKVSHISPTVSQNTAGYLWISDRTGAGFLAVAGPGLRQVLHIRPNFVPTFPLLCPRTGQRTSVCCISSITTVWNARVFRAFNVHKQCKRKCYPRYCNYAHKLTLLYMTWRWQ